MLKSHNSPAKAIEASCRRSDPRLDALRLWTSARLDDRDIVARARIGRRELQALLPRARAGPIVDRHGRAARARRLRSIRQGRGNDARGGGARARSRRAGPRPRLSAALRSGHDDVSQGPRRSERGCAFLRRDRCVDPLAAREPARRAAALRRSAAQARARAFPENGTCERHLGVALDGGPARGARRDLRATRRLQRSPSPRFTCTATTCRAISW